MLEYILHGCDCTDSSNEIQVPRAWAPAGISVLNLSVKWQAKKLKCCISASTCCKRTEKLQLGL